ncbi:MAG: SHOCT domain-containing protein [Desulfosarcinaceae bacterium]
MDRKTSTLLSIGLSLAIIALGIWFLQYHIAGLWFRGGGWRSGHFGMMGGGSGVVMIIFWLIVLFAVIAVIWGVAGGSSRTPFNSHGKDDALEILKRRYARGEIDKEEYESKRRDLER